MAEIPRGMKVRIEGVKPLTGNPYRTAAPDHGRLVIEHRTRNLGVLAFEAFVCAGLWYWGVELLSGFSILFLAAISIVFTYHLAKLIFNATTITVGLERLVLRHGPIPKSATREIARDDLGDLHCQQTEHMVNGARTYSFALIAELRSGGSVELLTDLDEPGPCLFAARQIADYRKRTDPEHERV